MYDGNNMTEFINNGTMIKSTQKAIDDLDDIISTLEIRIEQCPTLIPEMILTNHLILVKEQRKILTEKLNKLVEKRQAIQKTFMVDTDTCDNETIDAIDRIVTKLLAIEDIYAETHKTSNVAIMSFVEDLLKKKRYFMTK